MRLFPLFAALLVVPLVGATAPVLGEPDDDEFLTLYPSMMRVEPPASASFVPGLCHAPAIDIRALVVDVGQEDVVVRMGVDEIASRAFSCPEIAGGIGRPSYTVEFYTPTLPPGALNAPKLLLTSSSSALRCWGYVPGFFYPIACDLAFVGNELVWSLDAQDVASMHLENRRAIGRAEAPAGGYWIEDLAG